MRTMHESELESLGKTLTLEACSLGVAFRPRNVMFAVFAHLFNSIRFSATGAPAARSPAGLLMESAELRAGSDPHGAEQLRRAASAWLSVVR